jgi:hypothetical protein
MAARIGHVTRSSVLGALKKMEFLYRHSYGFELANQRYDPSLDAAP